MKKLLLFALATFFATAAFAQDEPKKIEIAADYSYFRAPQGGFVPSTSFNGGGASATYYFFKHIGLKAEFQDYGTYAQSITVPASTQGCNSLSDCQLSVSGTVYTYTIGPVMRFHVKHFEPFAEVMVGGAHNNIYRNIYNGCTAQGECINLSKLPNNTAFDFVIGGGLDLPFREHISFRLAQIDYVRTGFGNSTIIGNSTQDNLRAQAGIVVKF
jgi:outer membrane protein with beta-barrel domain